MVDEPERLRLESARIGAVPLINAFLDRLGLPALLHSVLAVTDPRLKLAPATAVRLVVINLLIGREPIYGLSEWAARYSPDLLGLSQAELAVLNDDRVGRALDALFDADRASLLTAVVLGAVRGFGVDTSRGAQRLDQHRRVRGLLRCPRAAAAWQAHPGDHVRA